MARAASVTRGVASEHTYHATDNSVQPRQGNARDDFCISSRNTSSSKENVFLRPNQVESLLQLGQLGVQLWHQLEQIANQTIVCHLREAAGSSAVRGGSVQGAEPTAGPAPGSA